MSRSRSPQRARRARRHGVVLAGLTFLVLAGSACTDNADDAGTADGTAVTVSSTSDACELSATEAPSGDVTFEVTNDGTDATEFYVYADDGERIVAEVENIGPGLTRDLVVELQPGTYVTACKPGMAGDGIRGTFTVTD